MKCIITRASIINRCNRDGILHLFMTEKERPCDEAELIEIIDKNGERCSRFTINLETIEDINKLSEKYNIDILVTKNLEFENLIALVLYDEEIDQKLY